MKQRQRGEAWFFFPSPDANASCDCHCQTKGVPYMTGFLCQDMICNGPALNASVVRIMPARTFLGSADALPRWSLKECSCGQEDPIKGKPWIVYIHGGEWAECTNINEYYAMFASHIAAATQMGVLAVDFRTLQAAGGTGPVGYPDENGDVVQALEWLKGRGASKLYLVGDSSGATQVVQTLLQLGDMRAHGQPTVPVEAGVGFSAWLDMVGSSPTYDSLQTCDNNCQGIGTQIYLSSPSGSRLSGMCSALPYAKSLPINHPIISPSLATPELLRGLPPLMLVRCRPPHSHSPWTPVFGGSRSLLQLWLIF